MKSISLRRAILDDLPVLLEFEQGIVAAERPYDETLVSGHINYYDIKEMITSLETEVIVAVCESKIIGSAYVSIKQAKSYLKHDQYAYLGFMFVKPDYRGKGVSQMIIEEAKQIARLQNINELRLDVYEGNIAAVKAYEKAGLKKHFLTMRSKITEITT